MLSDPRARRAYLLTKAAVFALSALATWPLAKVFGARAWWGLAAFGAALLVTALLVLAAGRWSRTSDAEVPEEADAEPPTEPGEPVVLPVEDSLDLHPFAPRDIPRLVVDYLEAAHAEGYREVRLIHGRGIGAQRDRVRTVLSDHPLVESFRDAPPARGGWGATVAHLREAGDATRLGSDP